MTSGRIETTKNFIRGKVCENCNFSNYELGCMSPDRTDCVVGYPYPGSCPHWKKQSKNYKFSYGVTTLCPPNKLRLRRE